MFENFGFAVTKLLKVAENERYSLKHPYVGSEHLLLAILKNESEISNTLKKYHLTYDSFRSELENVVGSATKASPIILYTPLLKRVLENSLEDAIENNNGTVTEQHLILSMLEEGEGIAIRLLLGMDIDLEEIYNLLKKNSKLVHDDSLEILKIGTDLSNEVKIEEKLIGRDQEISMMIETLIRKKKNNPVLVGPAGVGKTAIVEELARRIKLGNVPAILQDKRIITLEMGSLVSGTKYRGEFEERLTKIINELKTHSEIILFIDEIHTMVNAGGAEGAINASDILKPYLARGVLKCIGATTTSEYYEYIAKDKALDRRFELIQIEEPDMEETKHILASVKSEYEKHHDLIITDENINDIVEYADCYLFNKHNPDKSLELLDSVCARMKTKDYKIEVQSSEFLLEELHSKKEMAVKNGDFEEAIRYKKEEQEILSTLELNVIQSKPAICKDDILAVIEMKSRVPVLDNRNKKILALKEYLEKNIFGQKIATENIINRLGEKNEKKPLSMLFVGPTGVGKTEIVKQIHHFLTPKEEMIRLDMSEYNQEIAINKLIGAPSGYVGYNDNYLFRSIKDHPFRVILLDEIEKAHPRVLNLFLQILDEGYVTDSKGEKINFSQTYIFMTSNIKIGNQVGFVNKKNEALEEVLSKELIARLDEVITFDSINENAALEYVNKHLKNKDISANKILEESEYQNYGMRNLRLIIQKYNKTKKEIET